MKLRMQEYIFFYLSNLFCDFNNSLKMFSKALKGVVSVFFFSPKYLTGCKLTK